MNPVFHGPDSTPRRRPWVTNQIKLPHGPSAISGRATKVTAALAHKGHS